MKICPWCEAGYSDELTTCPLHGGLLSEIRDLKPGMLVRNTYRIVRKLSKGGMAHVYLAQHILLNEPQVLKFLSAEMSQDADWTSRFLREVRTLRLIHHKNVVNAGNLEPAEDGTLFFTMEFVDGPDLLELYRRAPKPFDVALALELTRGAAQGLGAAHAVGVVHRDIKPENILLAREGKRLVPKIGDFGIVATREGSRLTQGGTALLTPQFAAPEQWMGTPTAELDGRTDLYALGGVLFELLTGRCAFDADNYQAWAQQHQNAPPPAPSSLRPELKQWRGLDELVLCLLAKNPADRPENVAAAIRLMDAIIHVPPEPRIVVPLEQRIVPPIVQHVVPPIVQPLARPPEPQETEPRISDPQLSDGAHPPRPELVPTAAGAAEAQSAESAPKHRHRARLTSEPMPIWESTQLQQPSIQARTFIRAPESSSPETARPHPLRTALIAAAVLLVLAFAAKRIMVNPVNVRVLTNQHDAIFAVTFAPHGLNLASASRDNTIQFWDVPRGLPLGTINALVTSMAYSPDGRVLATGMGDYSIDIWDTSREAVLGTMAGHSSRVAAVAFSPDGQTLASASWDKSVRLWDVSSGRLLRTLDGHTDHVLSLAYSPDGKMLASAGADHTIRIWDPAQGVLLRTLQGHTRAINSVTFSPDGHTLASGSDDLTVKLWTGLRNGSSSQPMRTLQGHSGPVLSLAFSPDGRSLVSGSADATLRLWDVPSGRPLRTLEGHTGPVFSVAFSPDGFTIASGSSDKTIRLWAVASLRE